MTRRDLPALLEGGHGRPGGADDERVEVILMCERVGLGDDASERVADDRPSLVAERLPQAVELVHPRREADRAPVLRVVAAAVSL